MILSQINGAPNGIVTDSNLKNIVLAEMQSVAPILNLDCFYSFTGNSDNVLPFADNAIGAFRALGTDFTGVTVTSESEVNVPLKLFGDNVKTDRAYQDRGLSLDGFHLSNLRRSAQTLGRHFTDLFINGTGLNNTISGLVTLIDEAQTVNFDGDDGGELPAGNATAERKQQAKFMETLGEVINSVKGTPSALFMTAKLLSRIETIAKEWVTVSMAQDIVGNSQKIVSIQGIPVIITGYKKDGTTLVQPLTETCGNSTNCTSIYAVKFGERADTTFATTPVGLKVQTEQSANLLQTKIELQYNLAILEAKSAYRMAGVIIPTF